MVVKPSSYTPVCGAVFMDAVAAAGIPDGSLTFCPAAASEVGNHLVDHVRDAVRKFHRFQGGGPPHVAGPPGCTRAEVAEAGVSGDGGKDAIVVDETADLDAAGGRGAERFRLSGAEVLGGFPAHCGGRGVRHGPGPGGGGGGKAAGGAGGGELPGGRGDLGDPAPRHPGRNLPGPAGQGQAGAGRAPLERDGGYYIEPTIFADVPPRARLAQHEIFGPVLSVIRARNFAEAGRIFNGTEYGLTGGLYSRSRDRLERAKREFYVGNLYLNRQITGALVGVQPFGGFKLSGSNAKAGGPDYLRLFLEMKTVAEKIQDREGG